MPGVAEPEVKRLQGLLDAAKIEGEVPIAFYVADVNNDGKAEIVGTSFGGSMGVLGLVYFIERNGKAEEVPGDIPEPKGTKPSEESWYQFLGYRDHLLWKLCDRTIVSFSGEQDGAFDGFVWKDGKTTRACDPDWTSHELSVFKSDYDAKRFERAKGVLRGYLRTCGPQLPSETRLSILSNLAVTSLRLGDFDDCLDDVKQARKIAGFESSKTKPALLFNESACANPPVDATKANYRWLVDRTRLPTGGFEVYEAALAELLAATVPPLDFKTAQLDTRVKGWLGAGIRVPRGAVKAHSQIELRRMIHDRQVVPGDGPDDGHSVTGGRYVTLWGCMPHDCEDRSMIWVDVQTGTSGFATNDLYGCFAVGSRTFGAKDLPAAFKDALADWKKNKQPLSHDCTLFIDGTKRVTRIAPLQ